MQKIPVSSCVFDGKTQKRAILSIPRENSPTLRDRVNASAMGYHAVCLLEQGKYNRIVGMKGEKLVDYPVDEALEMTKSLDPVLVDVCNTISI